MKKKPLVFISYVSENRISALSLYQALEGQALVRPWMAPDDIKGGDDWDIRLRKEIKRADFFVPLISKKYVQKEGKAQSEVVWALEKNDEMPDERQFIIPVTLRGGEKHSKLAHLQTITERSWDDRILRLYAAMGVVSKRARKLTPKSGHFSLAQNGGFPNTNIATPCFFPSISGAVKSQDSAVSHLHLVMSHNPVNAFLVSAYDIAHAEDSEEFLQLIGDCRPDMQVLLDSGIYERTWLHREKNEREKSEIWGAKDYYKWAGRAEFDACFPYDEFRVFGETAEDAAKELVAKMNNDRNLLGTANLYPIVHPHNLDKENFTDFCVEVASAMPPSRASMLAIPERDLGNEVFEVAENIKKIRLSLNDRIERYSPLHILGAGNPLSILVYSICGADSFDGIDWCQTVAEYSTGCLYHPYLFPLFDRGEIPPILRHSSPRVRMLAHNLSFYAGWMKEIRQRVQDDTIGEMLNRCFDQSTVKYIRKILKP